MLLTKTHIPKSGKHLVPRAGLFTKLNEGLTRKLTLISAPAGFGKTTVVSDWINRGEIPTAWFSINKSDNNTVTFLSYIIASIQGLKPGFGQTALNLLHSANQPNHESIVNLFINDIFGIKGDFLLVFDDFHLIENTEIHQLIGYFLNNMPENIHLVISTRSDPNLPVAKLRSQQQLVELRGADLSFSANDISVLFNKRLKLKLSIKDIQVLAAKTEGWIAGLQLAALSLQGQDDVTAFINDFAGNNRYIMDYLIEEVLKVQSDQVEDFLLKTSIFKQVSASLCDAVLDQNASQTILEELEKHNMFVFPLDDSRHWYRYHHLFGDLLKQRLLLKDKATIESLHHKACNWFEQNNMINEAVFHALEIENHAKAIQLLGDSAAQMWETGQHEAILDYGNLLPAEIIKSNADFSLYYAWILVVAGELEKATPFLAAAEEVTKKTYSDGNLSKEKVDQNKKLTGKIAVALTYLNSLAGRPAESLEYSKIAMENLSEDDPLWFSWAWFATAITEMALEKFPESIGSLNKALDYGKKSGNLYLISTIVIRSGFLEQRAGMYKSAYKKYTYLVNLMQQKGYADVLTAEWTYSGMYSLMAYTEVIWGNTDKAFESVKIAEDLAQKGGNLIHRALALMAYPLVLLGKGDLAGAVNKTNALGDLIKENNLSPVMVSSYIALKTYLLIELDQIDQADELVKEHGLSIQGEITFINDHGYIGFARLLIAQGKLADAKVILTKLHALSTAGGRIERLIEIEILFGVIDKMDGEIESATEHINEAMILASNEDLVMDFIFDIDFTQDLIATVFDRQKAAETKLPAQFIDKLKSAIANKEKQAKAQATSVLSIRELDTLKLIAEDLGNQAIADKLFISLNTVKTHLKNINAKLDVNSRSKAVAKAQKMGLL